MLLFASFGAIVSCANPNTNTETPKTWTKIQDAAFGTVGRTQHSAVVLNNEIYVIGGNSSTSLTDILNEVWKSSDGITWTLISGGTKTTANVLPTIKNHSSLVFNNTIYVLGGFTGSTYLDQVWKSSDGISWTKISGDSTGSPFTATNSTSALVFKNNLYLLGGVLLSVTNQVWKSTGTSSTIGVDWTLVAGNIPATTVNGVTTPERTVGTPFTARSQHSSVVLNNQIHIFEGISASARTDRSMWKSSDGVDWIQIPTPSPIFSPRRGYTSVLLDEHVYILGGTFDSNYFQDMWKSSEAQTWTKVSPPNDFPARRGHASVVLDGAIYVIGGFSGTYFNDVWVYK